MKKLLYLMLPMVCIMLSCRSVKSEGYVETHHFSNGEDTMTAVAKSATVDSLKAFRVEIDSLSVELRKARQMYRDLYVKDSVNENRYRSDSVHVRDSSWMEINDDGSVSHYKYRETNTYSYQQLERYSQQIVKESQAIIDSLAETNTRLQARCDSLYRFKFLADSISIYKARIDSLSDVAVDREKTTIRKNSLWDSIKQFVGGILACLLILAIVRAWRYFRGK